MVSHQTHDVQEPSQVGEARRCAAGLAAGLGFDEVAAGRLALVVTELGNNLARHAQRGRLLLAGHDRHPTHGPCVEVLSIDHGPGMGDVAACLVDGFSTAGTPGTGLGAVRRLSDTFSIFSVAGKGSVIAARVFPKPAAPAPAPAVSVAALCTAAPGETVSGDGWGFHLSGAKAVVMVADGLGHGPAAAEAAAAALGVFRAEAAGKAPSTLVERAHEALRGTRGAAVAVIQADSAEASVVFSGAGNVTGRLISGVSDRSLVSQHGTAGLQIRRMQDVRHPWPDHALVVLHSDGIATRWNLADAPGLLQCDPAVVAAWIWREHCRGRDDATVAVLRRH